MNDKSEIDLSIDGFGRQKILNTRDSIAQEIINLLFMKPGFIPNLPHLGIDINSYIYSQEGTFNGDALKAKIIDQCSELLPNMMNGEVSVQFTNQDGVDLLLIGIPITINQETELLLVGVNKTTSGIKGSNGRHIVYEFAELM